MVRYHHIVVILYVYFVVLYYFVFGFSFKLSDVSFYNLFGFLIDSLMFLKPKKYTSFIHMPACMDIVSYVVVFSG